MRAVQNRDKALYRTDEVDRHHSKEKALQDFEFTGDAWVKMERGGIFIHHGDREGYDGFAWDGCSPKFNLGPLLAGTWDGPFREPLRAPEAVRAAKFHDALYQDLDTFASIDFHRWHADLLFLEMLEGVGFRYASLYHAAVRAFGGIDLSIWRMRSRGARTSDRAS